MDHLQWYDFVRLFTAVFTVWAAWRLTRVIRLRKKAGQMYTDRLKDFLWLIYAFMFVQVAGALEAVARNSEYRYSLVLSFAITLVALRATRKSTDPLII